MHPLTITPVSMAVNLHIDSIVELSLSLMSNVDHN